MVKFLTVMVLLALGAVPALAFSPNQEQQKNGSREGRALKSYEAMNGHAIEAGNSIDVVARTLGPGVVREQCRADHADVPCLMQVGIWGELRTVDIYFFPADELRFVVAYVTPADADGTWFGAPAGDWTTQTYCDAIGERVFDYVKRQVGEPDPTTSQQLYQAGGDRFPTSSPAMTKRNGGGYGGYDFTLAAGRFTFPGGGAVTFERIINKDDDECRIRAIYELAD